MTEPTSSEDAASKQTLRYSGYPETGVGFGPTGE